MHWGYDYTGENYTVRENRYSRTYVVAEIWNFSYIWNYTFSRANGFKSLKKNITII